MKSFMIIAISLALLVRCNTHTNFTTFSEYSRWINNPESGLTKSKVVNGIAFEVRYLPPEFLAYQELKGGGQLGGTQMQTLAKEYSETLCFVLQIGPADNEGDIMLNGVTDKPSFETLARQLNFSIGSMVSLERSGRVEGPLLSNLENVYGLTPHRKFIFTFPGTVLNSEDDNINFVFDDNVFQTGKNKFQFTLRSMRDIPNLKI